MPAFRGGLLSRLAANTAGNTLMLVAGGLIPLTAMIGSGVDMARVYMVKSRLQQACDAGALAGRKYMSGGTLSTTAAQRATEFFNNNFADGQFGTTNRSFLPVRTEDGEVRGTASVRVPMAVMKIFGYENIDLNVACQARFEVSNTDVMLVLDVTGSMADCPDNSNCASGAGSKIAGLRNAVLDFYDTLSQSTGPDSRFRIGFVPYSSAVNMGIDPFTGEQLLPADALVDSWQYQSRVANMDVPGWTGTTTFGGWTTQTFGSNISNANCTKYGNNSSFSGYTPAATTDVNTDNSNANNTQAPGTVYSDTQPSDVRRVYERLTGTYTGNKSCSRRWRRATTTYVQNGRFAFGNWDYQQTTYNTSVYKTGVPVSVYTASTPPTGSVTTAGLYNMVNLLTAPGSTITGTSTIFEGCIEERSTVSQTTFTPVPPGAHDLDVNSSPSNDDTRWRPMWQELIYDRADVAPELNSTRNSGWLQTGWCPVAASKLAVRSRNDVESYVNDLEATGNTYHDLGMAWGVRLASPNGMFASENTTAPNGKAIARHIIFMTDGVINTPASTYSSHGYEKLDRRVVGVGTNPTTGDLNTRHTNRFIALCNAARANNMVVWTIAFGTDNPAGLTACADSGKAKRASNTAELRAAYQDMAANIAKLRLSQ